jgi:hypothetical protein
MAFTAATLRHEPEDGLEVLGSLFVEDFESPALAGFDAEADSFLAACL